MGANWQPMTGYNFTDDVRRALAAARKHAARLRHEYVGTEHILFGLIDNKGSVAVDVLQKLSADPDQIRQKLEETLVAGKSQRDAAVDVPYTSRAKKVLELAMTEARELGHNYVGTEHLVLGLMREEKGIAAQVLAHLGLTMDALRAEVVRHPSVPAPAEFVVRTVTSDGGRHKRELAFRLFWTTLGIVVLIESVKPILPLLAGAESGKAHVAALAAVEIIGALLFLVPKTMRYGAWLLLAVFAVAAIAHLVRGEFPGSLFVYAAGTILVLVGRQR
jgi:ClpA/ClpB-like protein